MAIGYSQTCPWLQTSSRRLPPLRTSFNLIGSAISSYDKQWIVYILLLFVFNGNPQMDLLGDVRDAILYAPEIDVIGAQNTNVPGFARAARVVSEAFAQEGHVCFVCRIDETGTLIPVCWNRAISSVVNTLTSPIVAASLRQAFMRDLGPDARDPGTIKIAVTQAFCKFNIIRFRCRARLLHCTHSVCV